MKLLKNILLFVGLAALASCETDIETPQIANPDTFVAPTIGNCSDVIVNADNSKLENVLFTWTAADFGQPVQALYTVYLVAGEKTAMVGNSSSTVYSISKGDLNGIVINGLGAAPNATMDVKAYVTAQINGVEAYQPVKSNTSNTFKVTTYAAPLKNIYAVGFFNGWKEGEAVEMWETAAGTNVYEGLYNLIDDSGDPQNPSKVSGFKILTERSWNGGNWGYDAFKVGSNFTRASDGNLVLPAGYWVLSVNRTAMSIDATSVKHVDIIGSFNSWNEAPGNSPLAYDAKANVWASQPVVFAAGGEFLIRFDASWDKKFGSTGVASMVIPGGTELVSGGGNIAVPAAGTYIVKFHANRTPYVVELVKQ